MLKNLSIKKRLMGILIFWLIILVSFGILAVFQIQKLGNVTEDIYYHSLKVSNAVQEAKVDIIKMHRDVKDLIIAEDKNKIQAYNNDINNLENIVFNKLDIIKTQTNLKEVEKLEDDVRGLMGKWKESRDKVIALSIEGKRNEAVSLSQTEGLGYVSLIEERLDNIYKLEGIDAEDMAFDASNTVKTQKTALISYLILFILITTGLSILISGSIINPIGILKGAMKSSVNVGELEAIQIDGDNELVDMSKHYNSLIYTLKNQFWLKDGQHKLGQELSGNYSINEITQKTINFLGRFLEAGNGVFYIYDEKTKALSLKSSFAFTERDVLLNSCTLGEGIIGQVALEKEPILLKNIKKQDALVTTGTISESPLNVYAFPLLYEGELYGVIEISAFEPFNKLRQELLRECSKIIAINLYSAIQNEKIKKLLIESEESKKKVQIAVEELQKANTVLEDQRTLLQAQTEELQHTNEELEEQQAMLQQQSAELQESNSQLEEQQQQLEEQASILNVQNRELEISKQELIEKTKQLESANRYKSEFLANMSHELRTPLNSIILLSKLLVSNNKNKLSEAHAEKIGIIYNSGNELLRLINDILDLSKIEAGRVSLEYTSFHSKYLLKDIKRLFSDAAEEKDIKLIMKDEVNSELYGDRDKISQVLRNLLSNALKFTEVGSIVLRIQKDKYTDKGIVLSVADTGIGIKEEQIKIIFEEFQQGDGSISRRYGGTGLGLSISKKLVELMKGNIKVDSTIGIGSEFTIFIPNLISSVEDKVGNTELIACTSDNSFEEELLGEVDSFLDRTEEKNNMGSYIMYRTNKEYALNLTGKSILIVDDDSRNIFVLASALEDFGAEVYEAENGKVALEKLKLHNVDLVLVDIRMPVMDGYDTIKAIRSDEELKDLPIIALTAKSLKDDKAKCIEAGADDYISKPIDYDIFVTLVKAWISKKD